MPEAHSSGVSAVKSLIGPPTLVFQVPEGKISPLHPRSGQWIQCGEKPQAACLQRNSVPSFFLPKVPEM